MQIKNQATHRWWSIIGVTAIFLVINSACAELALGAMASQMYSIMVQLATPTPTITPTLPPSPTPTITPTPFGTETWTPTATQTATPGSGISVFWQDDFIGTAGNQVPDWEDAADVPSHNAFITYSYAASHAAITRTAASTWGKVLAPAKTCDVDAYPMVSVNVSGITNATWKIGIQEVGGSWNHYSLNSSSSSTGLITFDYKTVTGWSGNHTFAVELVVEGAAGASIELDQIQIYSTGGTPTLTPTPGPAPFWKDDFIGTAGNQIPDWEDAADVPSHNAFITYSYTASYAAITRTAASTWGKVLAPAKTCDVDAYPMVSVNVSGITNATWKIGIQEVGGSWNHYSLNSSSNSTGAVSFNYKTVTGWSGTHTFAVELVVEGAAGAGIELDQVSITP